MEHEGASPDHPDFSDIQTDLGAFAGKDAVDPDNLLLARSSIRRLDAETLRDSMLMASGNLNRKMFGAPVPVTIDLDGQVIVGVDTTDTAGRPSGKIIPSTEKNSDAACMCRCAETGPSACSKPSIFRKWNQTARRGPLQPWRHSHWL